jgi:pimeloyl-ACP methyl ester carboxylesterase
VLVSPYGLWLDEAPMPDPFTMTPPVLAKAKWHAPDKAGAEPSAFDPADGDTIATFRTHNLSTATKFLWPIPDRGLNRRLQYVAAPTLIVRGASDGLFPAPYLDAWTGAIAGARALTLPDAGHLPMVEAEDAFINAVQEFLA